MEIRQYSGPEFNPYEEEREPVTESGGAWPAPVASAPLAATLSLPGSKSLTNRELVLAALADGTSVLGRPLHSRDTDLMVAALAALGTGIADVATDSDFGGDLAITPQPLTGSSSIDCGLAGTVMRFVPPVAALALGPVYFDGDPAARRRPMRTTIESLRAVGVDVADDGRGTLPFTVHGTGEVAGGTVELDASASSQFVSGLLLAATRFRDGLTLRHTGERLPSIPHIEMTVQCLAARGVNVENPEPGLWVVPPSAIAAIDVTIEPDLSNAAPFLVAALVAGGSVTVSGWPSKTTQVGALLADLLPRFGGEVSFADGALTVTGSGRIRGVELDLTEGGELAPALVALAAFADSPSRITGIGHLRGHETDRLAALVAELNALGGEVSELEDGLAIRPRPLHAGQWRSYEDHRIATAGAIVGLAVPGVEIDDIATTAKTLPQFPALWARMLAGGGAPDSAAIGLL